MIAMDEEVFGIVKSAFMIPVRKAVCFDLFGNVGRVFTQVFGNVFKGVAFTQRSFDVDTVFKGKVFLVARNMFAHKVSSYC